MAARSEAPPGINKHVKLRESCDSCLAAKVKCSKGRPLCSRCLQNGSDCEYSPSSRAGRKNRDGGVNKNISQRNSAGSSSSSHPSTASFTPRSAYHFDDINGASGREQHGSSLDSTTTLVGADEQGPGTPNAEKQPSLTQGAEFNALDFLPTPPFNDFLDPFLPSSPEAAFVELASAAQSSAVGVGQPPTSSPAWTINGNSYSMLPPFQSPLDMLPFGPNATSHPPSRPSLPAQLDSLPHLKSNIHEGGRTCDCFAACLQALLSLHNHSWLSSSAHQGGPPFDIVLSINREAIEGCSTMLSCSKCVSKIGSGISTMLLATIFGKVMSLYRAACFFRFGAAPGMQATAQLAFGAYTVTGEDRQILEIQILLLELRKVEAILKIFQDKFQNSQAENDETNVYHALTSYLEKNLRYIVEFLQARKGNMCK